MKFVKNFLNVYHQKCERDSLYEKERSCADAIYLTLQKAFDEYNIPYNRMKVILDKKKGCSILLGNEDLEKKTGSLTDVISLSIEFNKNKEPELVMIDYHMKTDKRRYSLNSRVAAYYTKEDIQNYILEGKGKWILSQKI